MTDAQKLVSVIIPIYKAEKYLPMCVDSVLNQTYQNLEVILVDDGSPDNCPAICDEYAQKDKRIRAIHQKNAGLSMARNAGLDICTGDYITFVDSDDALHIDFVARLLAACEDNSAEIAIADFKKAAVAEHLPKIAAPLENKPVRVVDGHEANMMLYRRPEWVRMITAWGKLYRRKVFACERFPIIKLHEDEALVYKLLYHCQKVALVDELLYFYTDNPDSMMANRFKPERMTMIEILDERLAFYRENGETGDLIRFTQNRQFMFAAAYYRQTLHYAPKELPPSAAQTPVANLPGADEVGISGGQKTRIDLYYAAAAAVSQATVSGAVKTAKNTFPRAGTIRPPFSSVRVQGKRSPDISPQGETRI